MSITKRAVISIVAAVTSAVGIGAAAALWATGSAIAGTHHSAPSLSVPSPSVPSPSVRSSSVRSSSAPSPSVQSLAVRSSSVPSPSLPSLAVRSSSVPSAFAPAVHREPVFLRGYDSATRSVSYSSATRVVGGPDNGYWRPGADRHHVVLAPGARIYAAFSDCAGGGSLTLDDAGAGSTLCAATDIRAGEIAWITLHTSGSGSQLVSAREIYHP